MFGKLVIENSNWVMTADGTVSINASQLVQGIYTLITESNEGKTVNKIVINK